MQQHWFYDVWAFIGAGGAIVMVAILLTTDTFRSNPTVSRWRDAVWLAWLAAPLYWVHQLEEYSLPVMGLPYSLPDMVCGQFDFPPYPACPIPMSFYPVVNISFMWSAHERDTECPRQSAVRRLCQRDRHEQPHTPTPAALPMRSLAITPFATAWRAPRPRSEPESRARGTSPRTRARHSRG